MSFDYIRSYYKVPAEVGRRVVFDGKPGIIVGARGQYVEVNLDSAKPGKVIICHPTWEMTYGEMGTIRRPSPGAARYQRWLRVSESFDSFIDFCRYDADQQKRGAA